MDQEFDVRPIRSAREPAPGRPSTASPSPGNLNHGRVSALAVIAHDLRGPLANVSLLLERIGLDIEASAIDRAKASARRAEEMIDTLSDMLSGYLERSRQNGDPLEIRPVPVDLGDVVRRVCELNRPIADRSAVRLVIESDGAVPRIRGDKRLLIEAFDNLLSNALRHAPAGSTVTCRVACVERSAMVSVADQGPGLSESDAARLFRPFTRLHSKSAKPGAAGLGLWIVKLIAERHHGRVTAQPRREGGAEFRIELPIGGRP